TEFGLASLNPDHPKNNKDYEYRGNIHSYFNYKILREAKSRLSKYAQRNADLIKMIDEVKGKVKSWILNQWAQNNTFTMWSNQGQGLRNKKQLALVNAMLLS
ncbi:MAG: hypothetical protein KDD45_10860, partial [Bdellovibrionales bacterium]|nr:hypothetical protein [Bdellovibrionales bacterium]